MKLRLLENNFSRRVSKNLRTTACFVQRNGGWALEEFKRSRWVNELCMFKSARSSYRSLPINQMNCTIHDHIQHNTSSSSLTTVNSTVACVYLQIQSNPVKTTSVFATSPL